MPHLCQFCANLPMITYEVFEQALKEALTSLSDPHYLPPAALCQLLGVPAQEGRMTVRRIILQGIDSLKPPVDTPQGAQSRLLYDLLYKRFTLKLTQEESAHQLHVSRRTINRLQQSAVESLTALLWEWSQQAGETASALTHRARSAPDQALDWDAQLQRELASLAAKAPHAQAAVGEVIAQVLAIVNALTPKLAAEVKVITIQPNLIVTVHPVLLHQVLLSTLVHLTLYTVGREIALYARLEDGNVKISLTSHVDSVNFSPEELTKDIPTSKDITIATQREGERVFVWITAPALGKLTVLAVDDNEDMVRFDQDCVIGTRYQIVHLAQGGNLFEVVAKHKPEVIVLDIMLPDIDGWRLLMRLHEEPTTRTLPVIVCTVIREEALARALGAAGYLAKPVRPTQFIQALDQACPLVVATVSTAPTNSATVAAAIAPLPSPPP